MSFLAENAEWENVPTGSLCGRTAIRSKLSEVFSQVEKIEWMLLTAARCPDGNILTERLDRIHVGGQRIDLRLMGVFRVSDGKILLWRDYFDSKGYDRQKKVSGWC